MIQYLVLGLTFTTPTDNLLITEADILFPQEKKQSMQFSVLSWRRKMAKKRYRKFEKYFDEETKEKINNIIIDHIVPTKIWDSSKFCSADWTITVNLQPWED